MPKNTCTMLIALYIAIVTAVVSGEDVEPAGSVAPSLIGADGIQFTQVAAAQEAGLTGKGTHVCVIDNAIDIKHPVFGGCKAAGDPAPCRVYFSYDAYYPHLQQRPPSPNVNHGTHVAGIAVGSFPVKLRDEDGVPLPYQRGVAYRALLGAIKFGDYTPDALFTSNAAEVRALNATKQAECDVVNMSWGRASPLSPPKPATYHHALKQGVILVAAAGNDGVAAGGPALYTVSSPAITPGVLAVAALNNTANPGALLELDRPIQTPLGSRKTLVAINRADTKTSVCDPATGCKVLRLPARLVLTRSSPTVRGTGCFPLQVITKVNDLRGRVALVQLLQGCEDVLAEALWSSLMDARPALILMVLTTDARSLEHSATLLRNKQVPVFFMRADDGKALADALAANPSRAFRLMKLPGAVEVALPAEIAGQPTDYSSMGPAPDLSMKPDIAAPGNLYSSLPHGTYQTFPGTSMASPYLTGVVALWKQQQRASGVKPSRGNWPAAARRALKNTAKPMPYKGTGLMYPPVKVGAGLVQAFYASFTKVYITPPELLLQTNTATQEATLTLINTGDSDVIYTISHKPAVSVSLAKSWYKQAYDTSAPAAVVVPDRDSLTVPARGSMKVKVTITLPAALRALDNIVSGYITFTPDAPKGGATDTLSPSSPTPLSVPYQGASKDYSTFAGQASLALFATQLPELDPIGAALLQGRPQAYVCDMRKESDRCWYRAESVTVYSPSLPYDSNGIVVIAAAMVRPVADLTVQVWCVNGTCGSEVDSKPGADALLGSVSMGNCKPSSPLTVGWLTYSINQCNTAQLEYDAWRGQYFPGGDMSKELEYPKVGFTYRYRLLLTPYLAAGDKAAGRKAGKPLEVDVPTLVTFIKTPVEPLSP